MMMLLKLDKLSKWFVLKRGLLGKSYLKAVDNVSFDLTKGEIFGLVGESGCGKTTLGRLIVRIYEPTSGKVIFYDDTAEVDLFKLSEKQFQPYRKKIQMIFQDPYGSLNPRLTVFQIVTEGLGSQYALKEKRELALQVLSEVGLRPEHLMRYPHEFSGGQRQRISIARALILKPQLLVCDEPVSALDVSVQAQVINLLMSLKERYGLTYLFIAHDLAVVKHVSDKIGIMYLGKIVEIARSDDIFSKPLHPYTKALISSVPIPNPKLRKLHIVEPIQGEISSPIDPPNACLFAPRCPYAMKVCLEQPPELKAVDGSHRVACFLY